MAITRAQVRTQLLAAQSAALVAHQAADASLALYDQWIAESLVPVPTPTPIPTTTTYPAPGTVGFLGDPSRLAVIDATHVPAGCRWMGGYLQVDADDLTLDGVFVKGGLDFYGRGKLLVRNSIVEFGYGSWVTIVGRTGGAVLDVEDSTLRWRSGSLPSVQGGAGAIQIQGGGQQIVALRNDISGTVDGIQAGGPATVIRGNWIHDLGIVGAYPNNSHNDGIQVYSGADMVIDANRIEVGFDKVHQNAAIFFQPGSGGSIPRPQVTNNYLSGGGFVLRFEGATGPAVVSNNVFGPLVGGAWGEAYVWLPATIGTWTGNRRADGTTVNKPASTQPG